MMTNLREESIYLKGARDVLMRLKDDFCMYLVPSEKRKLKEEHKSSEPKPEYEWFPINDKVMRKLLGSAMYDCLINDRDSLVRFLQGDHDGIQVTEVHKDKKGKTDKLTIKIL